MLFSTNGVFTKYSNVYFASTYTIEDKGKVSCASDPAVQDGYECNRQIKIFNITQFANNKKKVLWCVC